MPIVVCLPGVLRELAGGVARVEVEASGTVTVRELLDSLSRSHPALERRIRDETGHLRRHVNLFLGELNIRDGRGLDQPVPVGAELSILPAVSGG